MRNVAAFPRQQLNLVATSPLDPTLDRSHQSRPDPRATLVLVNHDILDYCPRLPTVGQIWDDHDVRRANQPVACHGDQELTAGVGLDLGQNAAALLLARRL